jgi:hypothetical protein
MRRGMMTELARMMVTEKMIPARIMKTLLL